MEKLIENTKELNEETLKNLQINYNKYFNYYINKTKPELPLNFKNWVCINIDLYNNSNIFNKKNKIYNKNN